MIRENKFITGADLVDQREELELSVTDHFWLCGMLTRNFRITEDAGQEPIPNIPISILVRYLDKNPEDAFVPKMPTWEETYDLVASVSPFKMSPRKFGMLFGTTGWTGNRWYHGGEPSPPVKRLFYILKKKIEKEGEEGFRKYLNALEEEAKTRGFENGLESVFKAGGWKTHDHDEDLEESDLEEKPEKKKD